MMAPSVKQLLKPFRGRVLGLCAMTLISSLLQVSLALFTRDVVDTALTDPARMPLAGGLLVANLLATVVLYAMSGWLSGSTTDLCTARLRQALLKSAAFAENQALYEHHSGALLSRAMEDVRTLCDGVIHALPNLVGQIARLAASFAAVLLLYPSVAAYVAIVGAAAILAAAAMRPVLKKHHARVRKADERMVSCMQEDLRQLELVKSLCAEEQMLSRFDEKVNTSLRAKRRRRFLTVGTNTTISFVSNAATAVMLLWGAGQVAAGAMSYGSLTAMLQLLSLFRSPVLGLSGLWSRLTAVEVAVDRLQAVMAEPAQQTPQLDIGTVEAVVLENVTFTYPGEEEPVLRDLSAVYPLDKWLCLSGVSGRGKSTVFKLILGLYQPQQGRVCLQTKRGLVLCGPQTRHLFAYVPQDYALLSGSIEDNLLLAAPDADKRQREKALRLACAEFVFDLADGEKTQLRENNDGLSKGQLQRIAVARALLMDRPILLMDECTSALDGRTERTMLQNIHALDVKAILVTHRPEALEGLEKVRQTDLEMV